MKFPTRVPVRLERVTTQSHSQVKCATVEPLHSSSVKEYLA